MKNCFTVIKDDSNVRAVILSAAGKHFTAGIDCKVKTLGVCHGNEGNDLYG